MAVTSLEKLILNVSIFFKKLPDGNSSYLIKDAKNLFLSTPSYHGNNDLELFRILLGAIVTV